MKGKSRHFKALAVLLAFTLTLHTVSALYFLPDKSSYAKKESIVFEGMAIGLIEVSFSTLEAGKEINRLKTSANPDGTFTLAYPVQCFDPAGQWRITVSDENTTGEVTVLVENSYECGFYSVIFKSPSPLRHMRTEVFDVSVVVKDGEEAVEQARLYLWDLKGERHNLFPKGNGLYVYPNFKIPASARLGPWQLTVTAGKHTGAEQRGGENSLAISVEEAFIDFERLSPKANEFEFGKPVELVGRALYPNGETVENASVLVRAAEFSQRMEKSPEGVLSLAIPTSDLNNEVLHLQLSIEDPFGNRGSKVVSLKPTGYWYYQLKQNAIFYLIPVVFVSYVLFLSLKEVKIALDKASLKRKRKKLSSLLKALQDDYFNKQTVSSGVYRGQSQDYSTQLDEIEAKLAELSKKQQLKL